MALFWYSLTDKGKVNLSIVAHELGFDVKKLEDRIEQLDKELERPVVHYAIKEPNPNAPMESTTEIGHLIRIPSKWKKRPG